MYIVSSIHEYGCIWYALIQCRCDIQPAYLPSLRISSSGPQKLMTSAAELELRFLEVQWILSSLFDLDWRFQKTGNIYIESYLECGSWLGSVTCDQMDVAIKNPVISLGMPSHKASSRLKTLSQISLKVSRGLQP